MASKVLTAFIGFFNLESHWFLLLGKLYGLYIAYRVMSKLWRWTKLYFLSPTLHLAADVKSHGKWAVVTGATDGIGKSYAELLAKRGMNVVLVSRSADKLNSVATEIGEKCKNVETKCVVADFSLEVSIYEKIENEIKDLDIGVLVNNVGTLVEHPDYLETLSNEEMRKLLAVNCFSVAYMTKMVLPKMSDKKKGIIFNVSSLSAHFPFPFYTLYAATKAFVHHFSESLRLEYKSKGIIIQCVSPGPVATKMTKIKNFSFMVPGPDSFVSAALDTVGLEPTVSGCFAHDLQKTALELIGESLTNHFWYKVNKSMRDRGFVKTDKSK